MAVPAHGPPQNRNTGPRAHNPAMCAGVPLDSGDAVQSPFPLRQLFMYRCLNRANRLVLFSRHALDPRRSAQIGKPGATLEIGIVVREALPAVLAAMKALLEKWIRAQAIYVLTGQPAKSKLRAPHRVLLPHKLEPPLGARAVG